MSDRAIRQLKVAHVVLVAAVAWGAGAFGAVYPWAYWPLIGASFVVAAGVLTGRRRVRFNTAEQCLAAALALFAVAGLVQVVPIPLTMLGALTPHTVDALVRLNPAVASHALQTHASSIAPYHTLIGLALFAGFATMVFTCTVLFSARGADGLGEALAVIGTIVAIAGIVQQPLSNGKIFGFWTPVESGTPFGPFVNKNHFAGWMLMAVPVTLGLLLGRLSRATRGLTGGWRNRLVWLSSAAAGRIVLLAVGVAVMALALVLTMSRSGLIAFVLAMTMTGVVVARGKRTGSHRGIALGFLALLVVGVVGWVGADMLAWHFSRTYWEDLNTRRGAWADASEIRSKFPLAGTGLNTYGTATVLYQQHNRGYRYTEAHNDYLQLAAEGGILLTVPAAACVVAFAFAVRRRFADETSTMSYWLRVGAVSGIAAIAVQESVEFSLQMPGNAALFAVLCGIALHRAPSRRKQ